MVRGQVSAPASGTLKKLVLAIVALVLLVSAPALFVGLLVSTDGQSEPSGSALDEVPAELLMVYRAAARTCAGLDWTILAAIHKVETGFALGNVASSAGAQGPMQFMPATFATYGVDGNGDGKATIEEPVDAIFSAASLLCANGAGDPGRLETALWNYNHSDAYVERVLEIAASYSTWGSGDLRGITLSPSARSDLHAGRVDPLLIEVLRWLGQRYELHVSVFKTGHSKYTRGGSVSNHWYGRAADISVVNGRAVSGANADAYDLVADLLVMPTAAGVTEVGHPFPILLILGGFTDNDHQDHVHVGLDA